MNFQSCLNKTLTLQTAVFLGSAAAALAQSPAATTPLTPRIAVVDLMRVIHESTPGKALISRLESEEAAKKKELRAIEVDILAFEDRIRNGPQKGLSAERIDELKRAHEQKVLDYQKQAREAEAAFNELQGKQFSEIEDIVRPIIEKITQEQNLDLIFDRQPSGIIFVEKSLDITSEVLKRLEANIAATASQPSTGTAKTPSPAPPAAPSSKSPKKH